MPSIPSQTLLSRVEDAGLNASAPPQQRWIDGWMVRFCPGKARRSRCVNAVAAGRLTLTEKLALCRRVFEEAQLPLIFRITPLSEPPQLDRWLAGIGMDKSEEACVMVNDHLGAVEFELLPPGVNAQRVGHAAFAQVVGQLRGSPLSQQQAHAQRLEMSPVTFEGWVLRRASDSAVLACGQIATEADMVGLYDVFTPPEARNNGWARKLCSHLLQRAELAGARVGYLQVDAANHAARSVYRRLGFSDGYAYHYRTAPGAEG